MNAQYNHAGVQIYCGDCREILPELHAGSVHCVVTSPPYWGLRDYGTAIWDGGDAECDHVEAETDRGKRGGLPNPPAGWAERACGKPYGDTCGKCGAKRIDSQIGLEPTPDEYIAGMVGVFREVRRVLRDDGTCWINMGDGYAAAGTVGPPAPGAPPAAAADLKPKDMIGMPWRLALALQAAGWYLRADIIWHKKNPMPSSATDRPTVAHEYIFLMSKRPRYFYDAEAIKEPFQTDPKENYPNRAKVIGRGVQSYPGNQQDKTGGFPPSGAGRNKRPVWTVPTQPMPAAHFATFPERLIEPCVMAGTSMRGACPGCGAPWERVIHKPKHPFADDTRTPGEHTPTSEHKLSGAKLQQWITDNPTTTTGWQPTCKCDNAPPVPCTVLDPFAGAGTTGVVAVNHGCRFIGIELSGEYIEIATRRLAQGVMTFGGVA